MKTRHCLLILAATAALATRAADENLTLEQLPDAVRRTFEASPARGAVKEISRRVIDGRTIYIIEVDRNNAPNPHLRIAEDGTLVREPTLPYVSSSDMPVVVPAETEAPAVRLADLPRAVRRKAEEHAAGREIADIDREMWQGRAVYEIEFRERGLNSRIYVTEDGELVRQEEGRSLRTLFLGTQLDDTPGPVRDAVRRIAGDREVVDVDRKGTDANPVYRVEIRGPAGTQELRLDREGKVLHDSHGGASR